MVDYHIIVNPLAGAGRSLPFVEENVLPLLSSRGLSCKIHETDASTSGSGSIAHAILADRGEGSTKVIIAGGDGTAHELIDGVLASDSSLGRWELIVLPLGTANALHSSLFPPTQDDTTLSSLKSALEGKEPRRLTITETQMSAGGKEGEKALSHIVQSTSLHANLLHDSESLRATVPGLERFKLAAKQNIGEFYTSAVSLLGPVRQWSPKDSAWVDPFTVSSTGEGVRFGENEEFAYFLASSTTPRLEPTFEILPTLSRPGEGTMDLLVMRPGRDPRVQAIRSSDSSADTKPTLSASNADDKNDGEKEDDPLAQFSPSGRTWALRAQEILTAAYASGAHIQLCYPTTRTPTTPRDVEEDMLHLHPHSDGLEAVPASDPRAGEPVAELFRCTGFFWRPKDAGSKGGLTCADGAIARVPVGGEWMAKVLETGEEGFWVYGP